MTDRQAGDACVAPTQSRFATRKRRRLPGHDYTRGDYFVTICTQRGQAIFGRIADGEMRLNFAGEIVRACWIAIPEHFGGVILDEFVVMPDHVHGIIRLAGVGIKDAKRSVSSGPQPRSLGTIIGSFKSAVSKQINERRNTPGAEVWQRDFFDERIVEADGLVRAREYIRNNPRRPPATHRSTNNA